MDKTIAKENLKCYYKITNDNSFNCVLIYGTLLGFKRESDFISYDEDIDIGLPASERLRWERLIHLFKKEGFEVMRSDRDLISLSRNGEYIDTYFFRPFLWYYINHRQIIQRNYILDVEEGLFQGIEVYIPKETISFLQSHYGSDWMTPKQNQPGKSTDTIFGIVKKLLRRILLNQNY